MADTNFYIAYAKTDINEPFVFLLKEVHIKEIWGDGAIELYIPLFYCENQSSEFFGGRSGVELDKEIVLRNVRAYYSTDKNKCKEFLLNKIKEQNELADKIRERMKESKLKIKLLEDKS